MMNRIKELYEYREMIFMLVKRYLRGRYRNTVLGFAWTFVNPLLQLVVYTLVFSIIMRAGIEKYYLYLFVALIPWMAMSSTVVDGTACIVNDKEMVTKIYFPRQVLPIVACLNNFVNMLLCLLVVIAVCLISIGINIKAMIYLIPAVVVEFLLALGISLIVSSLTVYIRDLQHILGIIVMAWQYMTPVMYPIDMVPEGLRHIFSLNPMTPVILVYRDILYYKKVPDITTMTSAAIMGVIFLLVGWIVFEKLEKRFAEAL